MRKRGLIALLFIILFCFSANAQDAWDEDEDGFCSYMEEGAGCPIKLDCNDNNPMINPDALEIDNDLDDDCNGLVDDIDVQCSDSDLDGYNVPINPGALCGLEDCNDIVYSINPGILEICDDNIDNNCDDLVDEDDPDCITEENLCQISADFTGIFGCESFPTKVSSTYDGNTIWMILWTDNCDEQASVKFDLYEFSEGSEPFFIKSFDSTFSLMNIDYEDGNGSTNEDVWAAPWVAEYFEDDDGSDPEFYFKATLVDSQGFEKTINSGMVLNEMLSVSPCEEGNNECPIECVEFGQFGNDEMPILCDPSIIDCSLAPWSSCNEVINLKTRDVSKCIIEGADTECEQEVKSLLPNEQPCTPVVRPLVSVEPKIVCGDGFCEEEEDCPEDCKKSSVSWWIFILIILVIAVISGIVYLVKTKMKKGKPKEEKKLQVFANEKDLESVLNYINAARKRGYTDIQINVMLTKGGWKAEQIKYAFSKVAIPVKETTPFKIAKDESAVLSYVENAKQKGYTDVQIKEALSKSGRSKEQIDYIFKKLK
ncbi:MAG: putative metal-binding motif-containing protein [Nanoarchaeota archaeon]|nr:putative metal-binding motif-containing protein [Nanoarchaeota archaeon]